MEKLLNLPVLGSEHGHRVDDLMVYLHWLMFALFVGWLLYFLYTLWRFRQKRNPQGDYLGVRSHASSYLEVGVAGIEGALLVFVAIPIWARQVDKFPKESEATVVHVMAQQFAWNARYAGPDGVFGKQDISLVSATNTFGIVPTDTTGKDDVQVLNEIHVPVSKPIIAYISSRDVIHSFKILPMRVTQDAIPGNRVPIWFKPEKEGKFQIQCAQLCGNGHANMSGGVLVVEKDDAYKAWLASKAGGATTYE